MLFFIIGACFAFYSLVIGMCVCASQSKWLGFGPYKPGRGRSPAQVSAIGKVAIVCALAVLVISDASIAIGGWGLGSVIANSAGFILTIIVMGNYDDLVNGGKKLIKRATAKVSRFRVIVRIGGPIGAPQALHFLFTPVVT